MDDLQLASDHYLKFHRRQTVIYLMGCTAMLVGIVVAVLIPGDNPGIVLGPTSVFFGLMIVLGFVERMRHRAEFKRESERIWKDEWILRGMHRSVRLAFYTVIFAQVPLMFFMAYVPEKPSIVGMGGGTIAIGCATWAASYLFHTRATPDE